MAKRETVTIDNDTGKEITSVIPAKDRTAIMEAYASAKESMEGLGAAHVVVLRKYHRLSVLLRTARATFPKTNPKNFSQSWGWALIDMKMGRPSKLPAGVVLTFDQMMLPTDGTIRNIMALSDPAKGWNDDENFIVSEYEEAGRFAGEYPPMIRILSRGRDALLEWLKPFQDAQKEIKRLADMSAPNRARAIERTAKAKSDKRKADQKQTEHDREQVVFAKFHLTREGEITEETIGDVVKKVVHSPSTLIEQALAKVGDLDESIKVADMVLVSLVKRLIETKPASAAQGVGHVKRVRGFIASLELAIEQREKVIGQPRPKAKVAKKKTAARKVPRGNGAEASANA